MKITNLISYKLNSVGQLMAYIGDKLGAGWEQTFFHFVQYSNGVFIFNAIGWTEHNRPIEFFLTIEPEEINDVQIENVMNILDFNTFILDDEVKHMIINHADDNYEEYGKYHFCLN